MISFYIIYIIIYYNIEIIFIITKQFYKNKKLVSITKKYKIVYKNRNLTDVISGSKDDLNKQLPIVVTFQLLNIAVETIKIKIIFNNINKLINK